MERINVRQLETKLINSPQINRPVKTNSDKNFHAILEKAKKENSQIKFSKHALKRMDNRDVRLNSEEVLKLEIAMEKAEEKGVDEALILMEDKAFIASIKNKTIITTIYREQLKDNVFTNIDGAVIV